MTDTHQTDGKNGNTGTGIPRMPVCIIVLISLLIPLLFNPYLSWDRQWAGLFITGYLASASITLLLLTICCRIRTLGFILLPVVLFFALGNWFVYGECGMYVSVSIIASIMETDMHEASAYLTFQNISGVLIVLALVVAGILWGHKTISRKSSLILMLASLVLFGIFAAISYPMGRSWLKENTEEGKVVMQDQLKGMARCMFWPVRDAIIIPRHIRRYYRNEPQMYNKLLNLPSSYAPRGEGDAAPEEALIVVLMVGESLRMDHFGINGYERDTTPKMREWREKGQLVSYKNTYSYGLATRISAVGIMTDAEVASRIPMHRPFFDALRKDGISTSALLPLDTSADSSMLLLTKDCEHKYTVDADLFSENHIHGHTIVKFREALADHGKADRAFFLVYDTGAHYPYYGIQEHKRFLPDDFDKTSIDKKITKKAPINLINAYDNSILEIDWELDCMMKELEKTGRPAVLIMAADHGEALGEDGFFVHGMPMEAVYRPAFVVWFSQAYKEKFPERCATFQSHLDKAVSHDHVMHTVLSLFGIRRGAYKADLDLLSPEIRETALPDNLDEMQRVRFAE